MTDETSKFLGRLPALGFLYLGWFLFILAVTPYVPDSPLPHPPEFSYGYFIVARVFLALATPIGWASLSLSSYLANRRGSRWHWLNWPIMGVYVGLITIFMKLAGMTWN